MIRELVAYQKFSIRVAWTHEEAPPPHWLEYYGSTVEVCLWQQPVLIANLIRNLSVGAIEHIARDMAPFGLSSYLSPDTLNAPIPLHLPSRMLLSADDHRRISLTQELLKYPWLRLTVPKGFGKRMWVILLSSLCSFGFHSFGNCIPRNLGRRIKYEPFSHCLLYHYFISL